MGTKAKTMHGARAKLVIDGKVRGIFNNCSYGVNYDVQPVQILGRFSTAEIVYTGQEPISVSATGFRVIDNGPHKAGSIPKLQDLLSHEDIEISLIDRDTGKTVMTVVGIRPTGYSTSVDARGIQTVNCSFLGLRLQDESGDQGESAGASNLDDGS